MSSPVLEKLNYDSVSAGVLAFLATACLLLYWRSSITTAEKFVLLTKYFIVSSPVLEKLNYDSAIFRRASIASSVFSCIGEAQLRLGGASVQICLKELGCLLLYWRSSITTSGAKPQFRLL